MFMERSLSFRKKHNNTNLALILFVLFILSINQITSNNLNNNNNEANANNSSKEKLKKLESLFSINLEKFKNNKNEIFKKFKFEEIKENIKTNINKNKKEKKEKKLTEKLKKKNNDKIEENFLEKKSSQTKIIQQGWLKYMEITENLNLPPKDFYLNTNYFTIKATNPYSKIPGKYFFYFELTMQNLAIYNSDEKLNRRKIGELEISQIGEDPNLNPCMGGIEKIGHFSEGFCFLIKFRKNGNKTIWEVCDPNPNKVNAWLQSLLKSQEFMRNLLKNKNNLNNQGKEISVIIKIINTKLIKFNF